MRIQDFWSKLIRFNVVAFSNLFNYQNKWTTRWALYLGLSPYISINKSARLLHRRIHKSSTFGCSANDHHYLARLKLGFDLLFRFPEKVSNFYIVFLANFRLCVFRLNWTCYNTISQVNYSVFFFFWYWINCFWTKVEGKPTIMNKRKNWKLVPVVNGRTQKKMKPRSSGEIVKPLESCNLFIFLFLEFSYFFFVHVRDKSFSVQERYRWTHRRVCGGTFLFSIFVSLFQVLLSTCLSLWLGFLLLLAGWFDNVWWYEEGVAIPKVFLHIWSLS